MRIGTHVQCRLVAIKRVSGDQARVRPVLCALYEHWVPAELNKGNYMENAHSKDAGFQTPQPQPDWTEPTEQVEGIGHWLLDLRTGGLFWSDEIYRIQGVSKDAYLPNIESAIDFYHPDDAQHVSRHIDVAISERRPFEFEFRVVRPDGAIRRVHSRGQVRVVEGTVISVYGVFEDVTSRKSSE